MNKQRRKTAAGKRAGPRKSLNKSLNKTSNKRSSTTKAAKPRTKVKMARGPSAKVPAVRRAPQPDALDQFIDAAAVALGLPVEPAWKPAVKTNLEVTLRFAKLVSAFPLPDESEPAPVFVA